MELSRIGLPLRFIILPLLCAQDERGTVPSLVATLVLKASNSAKHLSICLAPGLAHQAHAHVPLT